MKTSYIARDFLRDVKKRFPEKSAALGAAFEKRLSELRAENAGASRGCLGKPRALPPGNTRRTAAYGAST